MRSCLVDKGQPPFDRGLGRRARRAPGPGRHRQIAVIVLLQFGDLVGVRAGRIEQHWPVITVGA